MKSAHPYIALCGELYQVLGALGAPAHVLDKVSAAANGEEIPDTPLLPFAQQPAPSVAGMDGWRWVPTVATPGMIDVAVSHALKVSLSAEYSWPAYMCDVWGRMLSAAPVPPVPEPVAECTNEDSWNCKYCRKTETCAALKDERNFATPQPPAQVDEREASGWIPVGERLPEPDQVVVLMNEDVWMNTGLDGFDCNWHGAGYLVADSLRPYWTIFGEIRAKCLDAATHWMPLYPAPSADGGKVESDEVRRLSALNIEAAAMKLAACMDYPWEYMPEQGRAAMRKHAQAVVDAALSDQQDEGERG